MDFLRTRSRKTLKKPKSPKSPDSTSSLRDVAEDMAANSSPIEFHDDSSRSSEDAQLPPYEHTESLSPVSKNAMNALKITSSPTQDHKNSPRNSIRNSPHTTIRSVTADAVPLASISNETDRTTHTKSEKNNMPHATKPPAISTTHSNPPLSWQNSNAMPVGNGVVRSISSEFTLTRKYSNNNLHLNEENAAPNGNALASGPQAPMQQWSSAVGRANLGKSGRVIDRLMSENDMLKRDLNIERLNTEESKQALRMAEAKMEQMAQEFESRLHEASVQKTLLKRKERQVEDMKGLIDVEKRKTEAALSTERTWKEELEKTQKDARIRVEEAENYAGLMEGRVSAMSSHWKDQGALLQKSVRGLETEIKTLCEERRNDDQKIKTLNGICDQQRTELIRLNEEKNRIFDLFDAYKKAQEDGLVDIKKHAKDQAKLNESLIDESKKTLGELKWALAVKKNVKDAQ
ncbi:hypothetical protein HYFRA_00008587 [Hymenoscyphus fraxineus]|uniref:SWI5-dependent HO expression protein 3 n=1 Tax=Hymenoscyphus fraxineus TaxID=746836 RepID=A0A9N9KW07_9HELO|nr:hypothetical protein HYFRA_00008587 [Hymenoscyphus fraxineus]